MVDFAKTFGVPSNSAASTSTTTAGDRPKSQYWLNVGVPVGEGDEARFVSLPMGIALDGMKHLPIRGSNEDFNSFTGARNDLLDQIMELAASLAPGQDAVLSLSVQVRRINEETEAPAVDASNPYKINLDIRQAS